MFECCVQQCNQIDISFVKIPSNHPLYKDSYLRQNIMGNQFQKINSSDLSNINCLDKISTSIILENQIIYKGQIKNNKANDSNSLIIFSDGSYYKGSIQQGIINGYGIYIFSNKTYSYKGSWKKGLPYGSGQQISPNGTYQGQFVNGKKQGYGKIIFPDNSVFVGQFYNNQIHGDGVFRSNKYYAKGNWVNGYLQGQALQHYSDGSQYVGQFYKGKPHGSGKFILPNQKVYIGTFRNGKPIGKGYFFHNNKQYQASWRDQDMISLSISLHSLMARSQDKSFTRSQLSKLSSRISKKI